MPIYEYRCNQCGKVSSLFFRSFSVVGDAACSQCSSPDVARVISRVAVLKPKLERLESLDVDRAAGAVNQLDPSSVEHWARTTGREVDGELGTNFQEMADKVSAGERPTELYDPAYAYRYAVENKKRELRGEPEPPAPWEHPAANDPLGAVGLSEDE